MKKLNKAEFRQRVQKDRAERKVREHQEYLGYVSELRARVKRRQRFAK